MVELIFHVVTRNLAVFDTSSWESAALTDLIFKKSVINILETGFFSVSWHQRKKCAITLISAYR